MINRSFAAAALSTAALLTFCFTAGTRPVEAARPKKPTIGKATLSPTRLTGRGGSVSVRVSVKNNGASISGVTASSTLSGTSPSAAATLQASGADSFSGSVRISANPRTKTAYADVYVEVTSTSGTVKKKVGRIRLDAGGTIDDSTPPPPPNI
ncbi:MAG: hypothetical protein K0Q72_3912 [Armatimonadetes bacterium]|jgi:hypothetical protein|nr:hypothetical protein [Armatimonadota bacterium]